MECNRDEAHKAKSIAEGKLEKNDFDGAKKFASKAQTMYPCLDGISQMLATIDVYASSRKKINGETMDWYAVLSVNPSADEEAIKKQYRKLALLVHPDKNKCFGADGAFKLIGQAWTLLSDKAKRSDYDQKRGFKGTSTQNVPAPTPKSAPANKGADTNPPPPPKANKFQKCTRKTKSVPKQAQSANAPPPNAPKPNPSNNAADTSKNLCLQCKVNAPRDLHNTYLNMHMLCATCILSFLASQAPKPSNRVPAEQSFVPKHYKDPPVPKRFTKSQPDSNSVKCSNFRNVPFSGKSSSGRADPPTGVKTPDANGDREDSSPEVKMKTSTANVDRSNPSPVAKEASFGAGKTDPSVGAKIADDDICRKNTSTAAKTTNVNVDKIETSGEEKVDNGTHHWKEDVSDVWQTIDKLKRDLVDIYESTGNFMEMHACTQHEEYMKKRKLNDGTTSQ